MRALEAVSGPTEKSGGLLQRVLDIRLSASGEVLFYAFLIAAALLTRFVNLGTRVMSHDESLHTQFSWQFVHGQGFQHTPLMHGPLQFHLIALSYSLFGDSDATSRLPAATAGVLAVGLLYPYRRWLGKKGALVASSLMLVSPYMLYYSRYVRNELLVVVEVLFAVWALFRFFESRRPRWLYLLTLAFSLHFATKETSFIHVAQWLSFLGGLLAWRMIQRPWKRNDLRALFLLGLVVTALGISIAAVVYFQERAVGMLTPTEALQPLDPTAGIGAASGLPVAAALGVLLALVGLVMASVTAVAAFGRELKVDTPELDVLVVLGTMTLPQMAAVPAAVLGWDPLDYGDPLAVRRTLLTVLVLVLISAIVGLSWDWRRWLIVAGVFFTPWVILHTTLLTNGLGLATGIVGSLGYWMVQHGVHRGSQPLYYYALIQIPFYEFLPAIGGLLAGVMGVRLWLARARARTPSRRGNEGDSKDQREFAFPHLLFIGYWGFTSFLAYSLAGEKMPWLTVHITLPLILISGWSIGGFLESIDWRAFWKGRGLILAILTATFILATARGLGNILGPQRPTPVPGFEQVSVTVASLASLFVAISTGLGLLFLARGWTRAQFTKLVGILSLVLLFLLTLRTAIRAAYVHYDEPTEYLVYAHSATGVRTVMQMVESVSRRMSDGLDIAVAYDRDAAWPMTWYLRNYPQAHFYGDDPDASLLDYPLVIAGNDHLAEVESILGDRYQGFEFIRMWWPMQEYFNLTWERVRNAVTSPGYRKALWKIWIDRDYTDYGNLTEKDYSLEHWWPSDRMKLYVRNDVSSWFLAYNGE